jgi:hypothetical protein
MLFIASFVSSILQNGVSAISTLTYKFKLAR